MKIHELVEGVEYQCGDSTYRIAIDGFFEVKAPNSGWTECYVPYNTVIGMEFKECEFEPKGGDWYYFPNFQNPDGFSAYKWSYMSDETDARIKKTVGIYRTKEQAIEKARELGWVE